jgi:oxygen-independent coproporphyrinogen III oxidase
MKAILNETARDDSTSETTIKQTLIDKYNTSGPRYTSYPTALQFKTNFQSGKFIQALQKKRGAPISLYIHIPFCQNICYYCGCNKIITKDKTKAVKYLDYLLKEARQIAAFSGRLVIKQLHFGGGTPTFISALQMTSLMAELKEIFDFKSNAEISIEIDPRSVDDDSLKILKNIGFNRISIGVQDLNPKVQRAVNRVHSSEDIRGLVEQAKALDFKSINMDLIYGLPHQTVSRFSETLDEIIKMAPDRLSVYNYAHLPHRFKPQRRIQAQDLPSAKEKLTIIQKTIDKLTQSGYQYIGMDHFALETDELSIAQKNGKLHRNFQGYSTQAELDLVGLGVSSISQIDSVYCQNNSDINGYYQSIERQESAIVKGCQSTPDDIIRREVIMGILCNFSLDINAFEVRHNLLFNDYFKQEKDQLVAMVADDLMVLTENHLAVTEQGRFFVRNICMVFDKYQQQEILTTQYSKVI